ncbi:MAG TPA: phytanoyl-CoA dioxygenase family protein [Ilumatobacteraceae bacterium]|nr:phytanoyl-CoA dioxygenase family protein [Ilumatobacteraceae bacterium]
MTQPSSDGVTLQRFHASDDVAAIAAALDRDGAVIVEGLLSADVMTRVNAEVEAAVDAADPDGPMFNPIAKAFMGAQTKNVAGVPGISPTFATDVMCHPLLLALADIVLGPNCARYQLNIGQILQRGPGSQQQWLHRDEEVWTDVPKPRPELQLASVIALVDFTSDNGATRIVPGSHRWPDRHAKVGERRQPAEDEIVVAEMPAGAAVIYTGGVIHGGGANTSDVERRAVHLSFCLGWLRTEENNYLSIPPSVAAGLPRQAQELIGYAVYDGIPRGAGYLGMVRMQDPVDLLARGEL